MFQEAVVESDCVGLRPSRPSVRLEIETMNMKGKIMVSQTNLHIFIGYYVILKTFIALLC